MIIVGGRGRRVTIEPAEGSSAVTESHGKHWGCGALTCDHERS
jgi:hypothetical protein